MKMSLLIAVMAVLAIGLLTSGSGQGNQPTYVPPKAIDYECSAENDICTVPEGDCAVSQAIQAEDHTYTLRVWLSCSNGIGCSYCLGCAYVKDMSTGAIMCSIHTGTNQPDCRMSTQCQLVAGHYYAVYSCLTHMPLSNCTECNGKQCAAEAELDW